MKNLKMPDKSKMILILMVASGVLLLLLGGIKSTEKPEESYGDVSFYTEYLEERITSLCDSVDGVENAEVFLTLDCSSEYIYSQDSASDFLILSGSEGEEAVLLQEIYPKVRGIAVVCSGGDLPRIRETLTELLTAALDLPAHRIRIAGGA